MTSLAISALGPPINVKTLMPELREVFVQSRGGVRTLQKLAKTGVRTVT